MFSSVQDIYNSQRDEMTLNKLYDHPSILIISHFSFGDNFVFVTGHIFITTSATILSSVKLLICNIFLGKGFFLSLQKKKSFLLRKIKFYTLHKYSKNFSFSFFWSKTKIKIGKFGYSDLVLNLNLI